jgi:hypothetical protein
MPAGVFARGGDTAKQQKSLGFAHTIDFKSGIRRALDTYLR